jgi:hypothetical protein
MVAIGTMTNCSRIPLIRPPQDLRGAKLSNDEDYQTLPIMTYTILFCSFSINKGHIAQKKVTESIYI